MGLLDSIKDAASSGLTKVGSGISDAASGAVEVPAGQAAALSVAPGDLLNLEAA